MEPRVAGRWFLAWPASQLPQALCPPHPALPVHTQLGLLKGVHLDSGRGAGSNQPLLWVSPALLSLPSTQLPPPIPHSVCTLGDNRTTPHSLRQSSHSCFLLPQIKGSTSPGQTLRQWGS